MVSLAPAVQTGGLTALAGALLAGSLTAGPAPVPDADIVPSFGPRAAVAVLPGLDPDAPTAEPAAVAARLAGPLADPVLGSPAVLVVDALTGAVLLDQRGSEPVAPASTVKIAVAAAALTTLGPLTRLSTTAVYAPPPGAPASAPGGTLWLVGTGDTTLTAAPEPAGYPPAASLADLAAQVRAAGIQAIGTVVGDGSAYDGPSMAAGWRDGYVSEGNVAPVSALAVDAGRSAPGATGPRSATPDAAAARAFAAALVAAGVQVGGVTTGVADPSARVVGTVHSPAIPVLVERMLTDSDNDLAESLGRQVALARGLPATFDGATRGVLAALQEIGVPTGGATLHDTSGLSIDNRIAPASLLAVLRAAVLPERPELRTILTGLPVAGFSGTLDDRYRTGDTTAGAGDIRAKTGTLRIVTSLAGELIDADGRLLLFGFFAPVEEYGLTRTALDRVAVALASCGCGGATAGSPSASPATGTSTDPP